MPLGVMIYLTLGPSLPSMHFLCLLMKAWANFPSISDRFRVLINCNFNTTFALWRNLTIVSLGFPSYIWIRWT